MNRPVGAIRIKDDIVAEN